MHTVSNVQWEVIVSDVQGKLSNLFLWPGTLTSACLKRNPPQVKINRSQSVLWCTVQVIRGDVVEQQEITPFFEVMEYEVKCNYRCTIDVPNSCSHIHLFFISGDIHPVSNKPKLIARARLSFRDVCRCLPVDKYFTLYRRDRVTQNCIPGGYVRLGVFRKCRGFDDGSIGDRASFDHLSVCSSARDDAFPFTHPFETELNSLPPRPASAIPRMLISEDIEGTSDSDEAIESKSVFVTTERSYIESPRREPPTQTQQAHIVGMAGGSGVDQQTQTNEEESKPSEDSRSFTRERSGLRMTPWFGIFFGATLGVLSTVAAFTLRYLSRRNSKKRRTMKSDIICN